MRKTHYLNYRHVSSDEKLIAKAELLATQYRAINMKKDLINEARQVFNL